jgi:hypothetical protein
MSRKQKTEEVVEKVETEHDKTKPLSPIQKVRIMNSLVNVVESKTFRDTILSFDNGSHILDIFEKAANDEIEKIMTGGGASLELVTEAQEKIDSIVDSCLRLQEQLITLVKGRKPVQQSQPEPVQQAPQQAGRRVMPKFERMEPQMSDDPDNPPYLGI